MADVELSEPAQYQFQDRARVEGRDDGVDKGGVDVVTVEVVKVLHIFKNPKGIPPFSPALRDWFALRTYPGSTSP